MAHLVLHTFSAFILRNSIVDIDPINVTFHNVEERVIPIIRRNIKSLRCFNISSNNANWIIGFPDFITREATNNIFQKIATWAYSTNTFLDTSGSLYGTAKVHGQIWANTIIRLYYRPNGFLIQSDLSDDLGKFHFDFLEVGKPYYTVVAFKDGKNALIADSVSPIKTIEDI